MDPTARVDPSKVDERILPRCLAWFALALCVTLSCAPAPAPVITPTVEPKAELLHAGPLSDYVPAAGLRWLLLARPKSLAADRDFMQALSPLVSKARLEAYRDSTGIDLTALDSALIGGFDLGTLYLAEIRGDPSAIELAFRQRLVAEVELREPHPRLTRISGVIGNTPESLLLYRGQLIAQAVGDPTLIRVVEAFARGKLKRSPPALHGAALGPLADFARQAPVRLLVPGPFGGRWMMAAEGLFAAADAVALSATPLAPGRVAMTVAIDGPWGESEEVAAAERLRVAWEKLSQSTTGELFGLDTPAALPTLEHSDTRVALSVELELAPLVAGLRAAVSAEVEEILGPLEGTEDAPGERQ